MTRTKIRRVLVLDADMVPALTIARSLARRGCLVHIASDTEKPIAGYSNSVDNTYRHPSPLSDEAGFLNWLTRHTETQAYDLVIPVTERSLVPISRHRDQLQHVQIALPATRSLELALDKEQTMALAERVGVPVPRGVSVSSMDELSAQLASLKYPVVLKPARSLGTNEGESSQLKVGYAFDGNEARAGCEHGLKFGPMLLQEYFRGSGVGIELIARHGEIVYAFQHLRLHEVPLTGGGSSLRMSVPIEPVLLQAAERLMAALEWNGVAMVEFKWNAHTRAFCLMEINGRFWGSLPLADAAGADFPSMLLDLELGDEIKPSKPYKSSVYCRKLSSDLYWYEAVIRGEEDLRIANVPAKGEIFRELRLFFSLRHRFDVQSLRDPLPGLVDIGQIVASYYRRGLLLINEKLFLWRQMRAWRRGDVAKAVGNAKRILFVCYGNINRSALAEVLIRGYAEDFGLPVISAGFHPVAGRPADPVMVEVASAYGANLHASRSTPLTEELIKQSDVIFVMEKSHFDNLIMVDEASEHKIWLLGAHEGGSRLGPEIADPYGRPRESYQLCYKQIAEAVDNIKSILFWARDG